MNTDELLERFLSRFPELAPEDRAALLDSMPIRQVQKGTVLLHQGDPCRECFMVLQGCLRHYQILEGEEQTLQFYTEGMFFVQFSSYSSGAPSTSTLAATEDAVVIVGDLATEQEFYERHPKLVAITRGMMEQGFGQMQEEYARFVSLSPEERYMQLQETRPTLLQRVPQHQIASYIGVTPESLSRIRKRLAQKD